MDENLRLNFNADRIVLNFLVFACGMFNRSCSFDVMVYDLVCVCVCVCVYIYIYIYIGFKTFFYVV